jgi:undecaprenyl-diphosphatase
MKVSLHSIEIDWMATAVLFVISGAVAYLCIKVFVQLVNLIGMLPFVIYRLGLGAALLLFL